MAYRSYGTKKQRNMYKINTNYRADKVHGFNMTNGWN